ncbi:hypothetical protein GPECTOR_34g784 [Gonium pectorale]|uniref:PSI domain-containing protein n=1 Tax=Gonium pectorale TaxID=33097 RepID=A0A150GDG3_GONPE|nr:hypothetical protein GPECTOR_34g784 [Gonium pectorale]|eukprot:KXZ47625.1 hypothetical protein GPECTOR_34g784 [Gonium pectorale]
MASFRAAAFLALLAICHPAFAAKLTTGAGANVRGAVNCVKQKTPIDCDLLDDCVWCEKPGTKFGTGCYPVSAAKLLPKSWGVQCDKDLDPSAGTNGQEAMAGVCDNKPEASCVAPSCVWCTSAAVGGGCYTPEEAKLLPKAIFKCKTAPSSDV